MKLSGSNNEKFLIFQETETLKKVPYISRNGNPKKLLIFREMKPFSIPRENLLCFSKRKLR